MKYALILSLILLAGITLAQSVDTAIITTDKTSVDLLVAIDNGAAKALYAKFGFTFSGRLERQIWGRDVEVYSLKL